MAAPSARVRRPRRAPSSRSGCRAPPETKAMKAIYLTRDPEFKAEVTDLDEARLPEGDVTVAVEYSTINFKDGLALTNASPVVRSWPMVAGIDAAGVVEQSSHPKWKEGDR